MHAAGPFSGIQAFFSLAPMTLFEPLPAASWMLHVLAKLIQKFPAKPLTDLEIFAV